jgi:gliding motility-associated-like protein
MKIANPFFSSLKFNVFTVECDSFLWARYRQQVYESKGNGAPWNGENVGKKLPTGTYYYIITIKNGTQKYSGSVTIIY